MSKLSSASRGSFRLLCIEENLRCDIGKLCVGLCGGGCKTPKWLSAESGSGKGEDESANGCYESPLQYRKYDLQGRQMRVT